MVCDFKIVDAVGDGCVYFSRLDDKRGCGIRGCARVECVCGVSGGKNCKGSSGLCPPCCEGVVELICIDCVDSCIALCEDGWNEKNKDEYVHFFVFRNKIDRTRIHI
jgi:hypothetical protein